MYSKLGQPKALTLSFQQNTRPVSAITSTTRPRTLGSEGGGVPMYRKLWTCCRCSNRENAGSDCDKCGHVKDDTCTES